MNSAATMAMEQVWRAAELAAENEAPDAQLLFSVRELRSLGYEHADDLTPGDEIIWQGRAILVLPF